MAAEVVGDGLHYQPVDGLSRAGTQLSQAIEQGLIFRGYVYVQLSSSRLVFNHRAITPPTWYHPT